jgi:FtsP/CotA-like multicopper oxidase with cupredoxin domain
MEMQTGMESVFAPDAEIQLTAAEKTVQILPGASTRVWGFEGKLLHGSGVSVLSLPNNYLGPVLRVKSGPKVRINIQNDLIQETVLHPHGLRLPENCDGSPMYPMAPGQSQVYEFQVIDRACPAWFHPHPMMDTPEQVYMGLAGIFYVWDEEEEQAVPGASSGENDIPVIIQDRSFDRNNQLFYQPNMMWGFLGDRILVNGTLDARCALEPRGYRLRVLNGSNARTYKLAWSNGMPLLVIGTDGGLLPEAVSKSYLILAPGERVDLWADFKDLAGKQVVLKSLPFDAGMGMMGMQGMGMQGMGGGGMGRMGRGGGMGGFAAGAALDILVVNVGEKASASPVLGPLPRLAERFDAGNVPNYAAPVPFTLSMGMMMSWTINGRLYDMTAVAEDEKVYVDEPIAWEFTNLTPIPHPMHLHNTQFQVVQRTPSTLAGYAGVSQGFVDSGWKDTVLVWPGERVKIAMKFGPHAGMYMYHCHILEHEEMGMMRNLMVLER